MLEDTEIEAVLAGGYELHGVEIKGPRPTSDKHHFARVARAALSMGNLRDGGYVIIGIDDTDLSAMSPGLDKSDLDSWMDYDTVASNLARYADPPLRFEIAPRLLSNGVTVAVIEVAEFADIPHLCKKDYPQVLRSGALYVRTHRMPETAEVPTAVEMREVIDLAKVKALRLYVETAERAGIVLSTTSVPDAEDSSEQYKAQSKEAWDE